LRTCCPPVRRAMPFYFKKDRYYRYSIKEFPRELFRREPPPRWRRPQGDPRSCLRDCTGEKSVNITGPMQWAGQKRSRPTELEANRVPSLTNSREKGEKAIFPLTAYPQKSAIPREEEKNLPGKGSPRKPRGGGLFSGNLWAGVQVL